MVGWSNVLGNLTPKHIRIHPAVFFQLHLQEERLVWMCKLGVISQVRLKIEVELLLSYY